MADQSTVQPTTAPATTGTNQASEATANTGDVALKINQELYKRNFELAVRNQTLTTLRRLYELANTTLAVQALSERLSFTLTENMRLELTAIFLVDAEKKHLEQIAAATSDRLQSAFDQSGTNNKVIQLPLTTTGNLIVDCFNAGKAMDSGDFATLFTPLFDPTLLKNIQTEANAKASMVFPLYTENKRIGVLVLTLNKSMTDVTEFEREAMDRFVEVVAVSLDKALLYEELRVANQRLRELDLAKSEFMSIASHQLRTPLAGIVGYLSMLVEGDYGKMDENQTKVVVELFQASQRLVRLVNTFLNVTRIEAGRFTMNFTEVNVVDLVTGEVHELQPTADKKAVKLIYTAPTEVMTATVDADKLRDVFLNLIDNAIKYTPEGSVSIFIEKIDDHIHFHTKDTGVGIDPTEAENLFQKFVRGSGIARVQPNGSGLGLYIVKKIVEAHQGRVWVESEGPGKGSSFHVQIPLKAAITPEATSVEVVESKVESAESK